MPALNYHKLLKEQFELLETFFKKNVTFSRFLIKSIKISSLKVDDFDVLLYKIKIKLHSSRYELYN